MQPKHSAIVAGLTLALSFGAVSAPAPAAAEEPTPGVASDATDIDKGLYTQQSFSGVLRSVQGVSFVNVTPEMKYFTKYESHGNYNQGFSYGDGYNALGYYQFDRRWSLIPFMKQVYNYSPEKYSMLKDAIDRGSEISNANNPMSENGQLTELGRIAQEAFQGAYNTDPVEFSALQDAYAYNSRSDISLERFAQRKKSLQPPVPHMLVMLHTMPLTQSARPEISIPRPLLSHASVTA